MVHSDAEVAALTSASIPLTAEFASFLPAGTPTFIDLTSSVNPLAEATACDFVLACVPRAKNAAHFVRDTIQMGAMEAGLSPDQVPHIREAGFDASTFGAAGTVILRGCSPSHLALPAAVDVKLQIANKTVAVALVGHGPLQGPDGSVVRLFPRDEWEKAQRSPPVPVFGVLFRATPVQVLEAIKPEHVKKVATVLTEDDPQAERTTARIFLLFPVAKAELFDEQVAWALLGENSFKHEAQANDATGKLPNVVAASLRRILNPPCPMTSNASNDKPDALKRARRDSPSPAAQHLLRGGPIHEDLGRSRTRHYAQSYGGEDGMMIDEPAPGSGGPADAVAAQLE